MPVQLELELAMALPLVLTRVTSQIQGSPCSLRGDVPHSLDVGDASPGQEPRRSQLCRVVIPLRLK